MAIPIRLPDGKIVLIDTTDRQAAAAAAKKIWSQQQANAFADKVTATKPGYQRTLDNSSSILPGGSSLMDAAQAAAVTGLANAVGGTPLGDLLHTHKQPFSPGQAFQAMRSSGARAQQQYHTDHPLADTTAGLFGGLLNPMNKMIGEGIAFNKTPVGSNVIPRAVNFAKQVARSAGVGAVSGGMYGLNTSAPGDEVQSTAAGAGTGAAIGAGVPIAFKGVTKAAQGVGDVGQWLARGIDYNSGGAYLDPKRIAAQRLAEDLRAHGATPETIKERLNTFLLSDIEPSALDIGGKSGTVAARVRQAALTQPVALETVANHARDILLNSKRQAVAATEGLTADPRNAFAVGADADKVATAQAKSTPDRLVEDFTAATGVSPSTARGGIENVVESGRQAVKPMFDSALGGTAPVWNDDFANLVQINPKVRRALAAVVNNTENPKTPGIRLDPDTGLLSDSRKLSDAVEMQPTAETWDAVKKYLGRSVERNPITGEAVPNSQSNFNFETGQANGRLTNLMRTHIPGYGEALDRSGDYLSVNDAYGRAKGTLFGNTSHQDVNHMFSGISEGEAAGARSAFADDLHESIMNGTLTPDKLSKPSVQAKLNIAFGPNATQKLTGALNQEGALADGIGVANPSPSRTQYNTAVQSSGAVNHGASAYSAPTSEFNYGLNDLNANSANPGQTQMDLRLGARDDLLRRLAAKREQGLGILDDIGETPARRDNLATVFGDQTIGPYLDKLELLRQQGSAADSVNPHTNSRTELNRSNKESPLNFPTDFKGLFGHFINKLDIGNSMTPAQADAYANLAMTPNANLLEDLAPYRTGPQAIGDVSRAGVPVVSLLANRGLLSGLMPTIASLQNNQ